MEKLEEYIDKIPSEIVDFIDKQEHMKTHFCYLQKVRQDIENFKKYGTFKSTNISTNGDTNPNENEKLIRKSQRSKRTVLNENLQENNAQIKLERISEVLPSGDELNIKHRESLKENIKVEKCDMPPPQLPVKRNRKINQNVNMRSTRSKSSQKQYEDSSGSQSRDSDVILQNQKIETVTIVDSDEENQSKTDGKKITQKNDSVSYNDKRDTQEVTRSTRSRARTKKGNMNDEINKRTRSPSTDGENESKEVQSSRHTKRKKSEEISEKENSVYEDAHSQLANSVKSKMIENESNKNLNETYVTQKINNGNDVMINGLNQTKVIEEDLPNSTMTMEKPTISNETIIVEKPKFVNIPPLTPVDLKDIMTDDEDDNIIVTLSKKGNKIIKKGTKAIFSPFEGSPVKKRVEAFEKLGAEVASEMSVRPKRTKPKPQVRNKEKESEMAEKLSKLPIKDKKDQKSTPQTSSRYLPTISCSANKVSKLNFVNESIISTKSASALKASEQEFKERELRRREKEGDAIRKRDALLQAQIEEKKKKREEKQSKAQQLREALEKNKQKMFEETEKTKEEKYKQVIAERQEKLRKQQEETERRRLDAFKKAAEEKRKEDERRKAAEEEEKRIQAEKEEKRIQAEKEKVKQEKLKKIIEEERKASKMLDQKKKLKGLPTYLKQKAPLLPTEDCYDSDQENVDRRKIRQPAWTSKERMVTSLNVIQYSKTSLQNIFFGTEATTPNLCEIFENIDPKKLKRTSSAIWRAPPRYTLMSQTIQENSDED